MIRILLLLTVSFLASCGSSYHADFAKAEKNFKLKKSPEGPWKGSWESEVNGHSGPLWCLVSQSEKETMLWDFRYRAGWGILQFGDYLHQVKAKSHVPGSLLLDARMKLPNQLGTYAVKGELTDKTFNVRYQGQGDRGTMILTRP